MIFAVIAYLQLHNLVSAYYNSNSVKSLENKTRQEKNISDDELVVNLHTFINDYGLRRRGQVKQSLRNPDRFYPPSERKLKLKIIDLMKQSLYDTQNGFSTLDPVLEKYKNDPALRIAFIFDRLDQLIIDNRRVYTLALKWRWKKRVYEQIIWYTHCVRKFVDVLYVVELLIDTHAKYLELIS
ncbi:uncharacterized protein LOC126771683 [Nymphalis io]|uniref:uncharacterized protein LOC126771683 n=1 Tax=Inachis io TaxID=171585 RepID=UPI002167AAF7|nr:uncharacterized protein LOC126771683 [Nymphalis io]